MKALLKRMLAKLGWSLNRVPPRIVVGLDLGRDMAIVLGSQPGLVCVDVGANTGQFVDLLRSCLREPAIYAFEPAPDPFERLRSRHGSTPGLKLINAGLGKAKGQIELNVFDNQTLNSFLAMSTSGSETLGGARLLRHICVPVYTLDEFAQENGITAIDLLKIDTQGYELNVLLGASRMLEARAVRSILVEINFAPLYERQVWAHEIIGFLHERGMHLVDFYEKCRLNPRLGWCTALFARSETLPK